MSSPLERHRPLNDVGPVRLHARSPDAWLQGALAQLDAVLVDHAHCEKKAAANALSMLQAYPEIPGLPAQMARLAREESGHLARMLEVLEARGLELAPDVGDPYVQALLQRVRTGGAQRKLDKLLVAAIVEARSCERLALLAQGIAECAARGESGFTPELATLYRELAQSEDGHQALFFRLAVQVAGEDASSARLEELLTAEAEILARLPVRPAIH